MPHYFPGGLVLGKGVVSQMIYGTVAEPDLRPVGNSIMCSCEYCGEVVAYETMHHVSDSVGGSYICQDCWDNLNLG